MGRITLPGHPWGQRCQLLLSHRAFPAALGDPGHRGGRLDRLHPKSRTVMRSLGPRWHHGSMVVALCHPSSVTHLGSVSAGRSGEPTGTLQPLGTGRAAFTGESTFTLWGGEGETVREKPPEAIVRNTMALSSGQRAAHPSQVGLG